MPGKESFVTVARKRAGTRTEEEEERAVEEREAEEKESPFEKEESEEQGVNSRGGGEDDEERGETADELKALTAALTAENNAAIEEGEEGEG